MGTALENINQDPSESNHDYRFRETIQRMLTVSPDETIALLQEYDRDSKAITVWMRNDTASAATWLGQQPASEKRDQYTSSLVSNLLAPKGDAFTDRTIPAGGHAAFERSMAWAEFNRAG